jgi:4a-hydroxytetrahydrobiopterin dehydratase
LNPFSLCLCVFALNNPIILLDNQAAFNRKPRYNPTYSSHQSFKRKRKWVMAVTSPEPLSDTTIADELRKLPGWERAGDVIVKTYKFDSYAGGLAFASAVGTIADGLDHHPDITIGWKKVTVSFATHSAGNKITVKDIKAAQVVESLPLKPAGLI